MEARSELERVETSSEVRGRQMSVVRAALAGLLALALGAAAHAVSGGALPGASIMVALAALAVLAATLVAQLKLPPWGVMVAIGAAQQVLHWVLGGLGGAASSSFFGSSLGHHVEEVPVEEVPVGVGAGSGHSPEVMMMLHLHLAAALLAGWLVVRYPMIVAWFGRFARGRRAG